MDVGWENEKYIHNFRRTHYGNRSPDRLEHKREGNTKMDRKEIGRVLDSAPQNMIQWLSFVNTIMDLLVP